MKWRLIHISRKFTVLYQTLYFVTGDFLLF